ncbi:hypothetical protein ACLIYP_08615 [Streptomyces nanhaiensis]|uniref:hypothetical protein n=1 Tax=Streptomyces nanhaiensis TaxID=679319 RepID=UPI00399D54B0
MTGHTAGPAGFTGVAPVAPRPAADLAPLLAWLRTGQVPHGRMDFTAGTAVPDGRLDLCKQALGPEGAAAVAEALRPGPVRHLLLGTDGLGDEGARTLAAALATAPYGRLRRLSVASNGIGPGAVATLVGAAAAAGVEVCDLGRVRAAGALGARDNHVDEEAAAAIGAVPAERPHRMTHLVLSHTGMRSREAHRLLDAAPRAAAPTRYLLGKGIATSVRRRLDAFSARPPPLPPVPAVPADVAAIRSLHRQPPPAP